MIIVIEAVHQSDISVHTQVFKTQCISMDKKLYAIVKPLMIPLQRSKET